MIKKDSVHCSQCGSSNSVETRFAACVATSVYSRSDYPAPTTTTVITKDDLKLWKIPLCKVCLPISYRVFLHNHRNRTFEPLAILSITLILGVLGLVFKWGTGNGLLAVGVTLCLFIGGIGVLFNLGKIIVYSIRLGGLGHSGAVPEKATNEAFTGEGLRIIKALEKGDKDSGKVWGEFSLPVHKPLDEMSSKKFNQNKEDAPKVGSWGRRERDIEAIGKTIDELEKQLPSQWKSLWEQRKKNQPEINS